jgi:hypothetical protein
LLPEWEVRVAPWDEVAIDLIGPWKVKVGSKLCEFNALTCIDTASNLVELVRIDNKTAAHIRDKFHRRGSVDTPLLHDVYMTRVVSSLDENSNGY